MEQQWLIQPEALKQEKKISQLYEKLEQQMRQVEDALKEAGVTKTRFPETAAEVRGNIEFMNQLNQAYTYVQVPLKLSGQNANGELYVYTNKKNLRDPDAELSAFLHLDMEHLGSTDVSVKMQHRNVKTNFYMADDASYDLVEKYLPILEQKLKDKGYQCTITMTKEEKKAYLSTIKGVALGSDAFFPFGDNIERAAKSGVSYIAEPGGSIRDDNVIETCNRFGMAMAFTGMRLFHH